MADQVEISESAGDVKERIRKEIEEDVRTLGQKVAAILHPDEVQLKPCATLVFGPPPEVGGLKEEADVMERYRRALEMAERAPTYWTEGDGRHIRHHARFELEHAARLFDLYQLTSELPGNEVLIYDLPLPFARDLWLPLLWFHRT